MTLVEGQSADTDWVKVASIDDVPVGKVTSVKVGDRKFAVVNIEGSLYAMDAVCPHKYGPLDQADLGVDNDVTCPWHRFRFDPTTGECTAPRGAFPSVPIASVRVVDGEVQILVAPAS